MEEDQNFTELLSKLIGTYHLPLEDAKRLLSKILNRLSAKPPEDDDNKSSQNTLK